MPPAEAAADLEKAVQAEPKGAYARFYLWLAKARQGTPDNSILIEYIDTAKPVSRADQWSLLVARFLGGQIGEKELLGQIGMGGTLMEARERRCEASFYAGEVNLLHGEEGKAGDLFKAARETKVTSFVEYTSAGKELNWLRTVRADAHLRHAHELLKNREYKEAIVAYNQALALTAANPGALNERGIAYFETGDYDRAIEDFSSALKLKPDLPVVWFNRGSAYLAKGKFDQTIADDSKALQLKPDISRGHYDRGMAYYRSG